MQGLGEFSHRGGIRVVEATLEVLDDRGVVLWGWGRCRERDLGWWLEMVLELVGRQVV